MISKEEIQRRQIIFDQLWMQKHATATVGHLERCPSATCCCCCCPSTWSRWDGFCRSVSAPGWRQAAHKDPHQPRSNCALATWLCIPLTAVLVGSAVAAIAAHSHNIELEYGLRVVETSGLTPLQVSMPSMTICGTGGIGSISTATRSSVELILPPMKYLWNQWVNVSNGKGTASTGTNTIAPWSNDTSADVQLLMQQVMIEGGLLAWPNSTNAQRLCSNSTIKQGATRSCSQTFSKFGSCTRIDFTNTGDIPAESLPFGHYLSSAFDQLNVTVRISSQGLGQNSSRVGFLMASAKYFGDGVLCADAFGDTEANVACKAAGFDSGRRFPLSSSLPYPPTYLLGRLVNCSGDELSLTKCRRDYTGVNGSVLGTCKWKSAMGVICEPVKLSQGSNTFTRTRGMPQITTKLNNTSSTKTYRVCGDNFGNPEAGVICRMLAWPYGEALDSLSNGTGGDMLNVSCAQSSKALHLLDCLATPAVNCSTAAVVSCSPGFPLTLRLNQPLTNIMPSTQMIVGWPVLDTATQPGYVCDRDVDSGVAKVICKQLGYNFGTKLAGGPTPSSQQQGASILFALDRISCSGSESSIFDCMLGLWGNWSRCSPKQTLTVICAQTEDALKIGPTLVDMSSGGQIDSSSAASNEASGIAALSTTYGLLMACPQSGASWTSVQANYYCGLMSYACGMTNGSVPMAQVNTIHAIQGAYVDLDCTSSPCSLTMSSTCSAQSAVSISCLTSDSPGLRTCQMLASTTASSSGSQQDPLSLLTANTEVQLALSAGFVVLVGDDYNVVRVNACTTATVGVVERVTENHQDWCPLARKRPCNAQTLTECKDLCRSSVVMAICGCLPWYSSRSSPKWWSLGIGVCSTSTDLACLFRVEPILDEASESVQLAELAVLLGVNASSKNDTTLSMVRSNCACAHLCGDSFEYHVMQQSSSSTCPTASIKVKVDAFNSHLLRHVQECTWPRVLANVGAIVTFVSGLSLVCVVECVYFAVVACCCGRARRREENTPTSRPATCVSRGRPWSAVELLRAESSTDVAAEAAARNNNHNHNNNNTINNHSDGTNNNNENNTENSALGSNIIRVKSADTSLDSDDSDLMEKMMNQSLNSKGDYLKHFRRNISSSNSGNNEQ